MNSTKSQKFKDLDENLKDELFNKLELHSKVGVWFLDIETNYLYWSRKVFEIHELDPEGPLPNVADAINFYHPDYQEQIQSAVENAIKKSKSYELDLKIITAKKNEKWVHTEGSALVEDGKITKIFGTFKDITEEVEVHEKMMSQMTQLERMNKHMVEREVRMRELKDEIKRMKEGL